MSKLEAITVEQSATDILETQNPTRIAVYLKTKSPLYSAAFHDIVQITCTALNVPYDKCRLLAVQKWPRLIVMVFDVFYEDYDTSTAHHKANIPVLHVTHGRASHASVQFRDFINNYVATQDNYHGWDGKPPYIEDQTGEIPPKYENPRDTSMLWTSKEGRVVGMAGF